jgi:SnoaL-like domain
MRFTDVKAGLKLADVKHRCQFVLALAALVSSTACAGGSMTQPPPEQASRLDADRLQIAELSAHFADAVNRHDWQAMAQLHTEDAIWETSAGKLGFRHEGRAAILKFLVENPKGVEVLAYTTSTPFIETLSGERARTRLSMTEYLRVRATGEVKRIVGVYSDELVKRDGRWQFAHRSFALQIALDEKPAGL